MGIISKLNRKRQLHLPSSTQLKYALAYILITSVVLVFMNLYSIYTTRGLMYKSKFASLQDKAQLVVSSFSGVDTLSSENVAQVMALLGSLNVNRVIITDGEGKALYDSLTTSSAKGQYVLFTEIVHALSGNDVFYSTYSSGALESHVAVPVVHFMHPIGAVYLMDYDTDQGMIISALSTNILRASFVLAGAVIVFSIVFSAAFSRRMRRILQSIKWAREGEYSHKVQLRGHDELTLLAREFNKLTDRLQASEQHQWQFVSDASHELKTPLASIKLLSDSILQNEMDPDTIREFVHDIGNEADRLNRMAQKLLSLNQAEDEQASSLEVVDVGETVQTVLRMLAPAATLRQIRFLTQIEPRCTIVSQEGDLYQIIFNLVENGIKYNVDGGSLELTLKRVKEEVWLEISDTGIGVPEDAMPYLFDRFYRVDKARSREAGGSGLGLSIVRDFVTRNYGTVLVAQRSGGGTTFKVAFPFFSFEEETP